MATESEHTVLMRIVNDVVAMGQLEKQKTLLQETSVAGKKLTRVFEEQTGSERKRTTVAASYNKQGKAQVQVTDDILQRGPRFKMHYLGIMFAGMALNRSMAGLNSTSREWVGMSELLGTTMGVVTLPATMALLEFGILPLTDALLNLPTAAQATIGGFTLALEGLGAVLMVGGQLMLGLASLEIAIPGIMNKLGGVSGAMKKLAGVGVITIGLTLAMTALGAEGDASSLEFLLPMIGAALATGLGAILIGASLATGGIVLGLSVVILYSLKMILDSLDDEQGLFGEFASGRLKSQVGLSQQLLTGAGGTGGQGTIISEPGFAFAPDTFDLSPEGSTFNGGNSTRTITIAPTTNITLANMKEIDDMIQRNNQDLINQVRRGAV